MNVDVVREFNSEVEASLAAATLRANGIRVELRAAGSGWHTSLAGRTAVIARAEDVSRARAILDTPSDS
jgi:hypothetical protein